MARLIVKNIGPIKDVDIELKKVNVFMGPQSCGKSTLAKIISFCSWLEKQKFIGEDPSELLRFHPCRTLQQYHKLTGSYFDETSSILYIGDNIVYSYNNDEKDARHQVPEDIVKGMRLYGDKECIYIGSKTIYPKVIYIPAERNLVAAIPNLSKYAEGNDSVMDTIYNWYDAMRNYVAKSPVDVLGLGVRLQWNKTTGNVLTLSDGKEISLQQASSGLQSVVPLVALVEWLSKGIYETDKAISVEQRDLIQQVLAEYFHASQQDDKADMKERLDKLIGMARGMSYTHTQFIVEEPEQNLFPETQCELLYYLLSSLNHGKNHRMVITTHSPYILYALNNCLLRMMVKDQMPADEQMVIGCRNVDIDPHDVAVWEIENGRMKVYDGGQTNRSIQDEDGLIRKNYFNNVMRKVMSDFNTMLTYKD